MEKDLQDCIISTTKKASDIETERTGIEPTMAEDDVRSYLEFVMNEVKKRKIA